MTTVTEIKNALLHLFFPHICSGCGSDVLEKNSTLCSRCISRLPITGFEAHAGNPVEKKFWGRLQLEHAMAQYYFTKESLIQRLLHQVKYRNNKDLGLHLGKLMGETLQAAPAFHVDALVPLPLFPDKEKQRGYNQAQLLCEGIASSLPVPILNEVIIRPHYTESQTKKGRIERWKNIEGKFVLKNAAAIAGKNILLVDDVITTGATMEACGAELLKAPGVKLSIASLSFTTH